MKTRISFALIVCVTLLMLSLVVPGRARTPSPTSAASVSTPYGFRVLGQIAGLNSASVAVQGNYAYVGTYDLHFIAINVTDPARPVIVSDLELNVPVSGDDRVFARVGDIAILGQSAYLVWGYGPTAYIAKAYGGIIRIDISNPAQPIQRDGAYSPTNNLRRISVQNDSAYVCQSGAGSLESMQVQGLTRIVGEYCNDLILANNLAYTVDGGCGRYNDCSGSMSIIDYSNPDQGQQIGYYDFGFYTLAPAYAIEKKNQYAYVVGGHVITTTHGLQVLDVSLPSTPTVVSTENLQGNAWAWDWDVQLWMNNYLFIGSRDGLRALDVTVPAHPTLVGTQTTPGDIIQIATDNQHIYAAYNDFYGHHGFIILDFVPPAITGRVTDWNSSPVPNVRLTLNTGLTTTTNLSGSYALAPLQWMTYTLTPTLPGYAFWPSSHTVALPPAPVSVNFIRLARASWITVTAGSQATLINTDTQGLPTTLTFPTSAFSQTTTIALTPTIVFPSTQLGFTGHAFDLAAYHNGAPLANLIFQAPVTVTIHYSNDDLRLIRDENALALWTWNGQAWIEAAATCEPASSYQRVPDQNILSLPICRVGRYALFGPTNSVLLPIIFVFHSP